MQRVVIIDYGSGNLHSAAKAFERAARESEANATIEVTSDAKALANADRVVLPGVGAFGDCKAGLERVPGLVETLYETVHGKARPFLGICVGMQLLARVGREFKDTKGLDWIAGEVRAIEPNDPALKIPHMGWNTLEVKTPHALLRDIAMGDQGLHAYFVHSYHFIPEDADRIVATTTYGSQVTAMVAKDNMAGTQFHPEKSQALGLKLLANFLHWVP